MLDPEIQAVLDAQLSGAGPPAAEVSVALMRKVHDADAAIYSGPGEDVAEVRDLVVPGPGGDVPVRLYRPAVEGPAPGVAYFHGGGWAIGSIDSFDTVCRRLANASGAAVASVGYRLAPEHVYPSALDDCLAATRWLIGEGEAVGIDTARIAVAGDSAGGNLAVGVARCLRADVRFQALVYPVCDAGLNTPSYREFCEGFGLTAAVMRRFWDLYLAGKEGGEPDASPLRATDLAGLPPAFVLTAECDVLRDEGEAFAAALREAGVEVEHRRYDGTIHGFWRWLAKAQVTHEAVEEVAGALRRGLA